MVTALILSLAPAGSVSVHANLQCFFIRNAD